MRRTFWRGIGGVALAAAALALAAGCGGGGQGTAAATTEGAALVPASVRAFLSMQTDLSSPQWQTLGALVRRFPAGPDAMRELERLAPALGPEVEVALLGREGDEGPGAVLLTRPADPAALEERLRADGREPVWAVENGWYLVARSRATLERVRAGAEAAPLSGSTRYRTAVGGLPADAVATVYLAGSHSGAGGNPLLSSLAAALSGGIPPSLGLAAIVEPEGLRLSGTAYRGGLPELPPVPSGLTAFAPADVLAYASLPDLEPLLDRLLLRVDPAGGRGLVEKVLGPLRPLADGEHVLYVRTGKHGPELTLLLAPRDPAAALAALDHLVNSVGAIAPLTGDAIPSLAVRSVTIDGVPAERVEIPEYGASIFYARVGAHVVVSTDERGIADLASPVMPRLADDPGFARAAAAAALPSETDGFVWVDLARALTRAGVAASPGPPLSLLVYAVPGAGNTAVLAGFLGVA